MNRKFTQKWYNRLPIILLFSLTASLITSLIVSMMLEGGDAPAFSGDFGIIFLITLTVITALFTWIFLLLMKITVEVTEKSVRYIVRNKIKHEFPFEYCNFRGQITKNSVNGIPVGTSCSVSVSNMLTDRVKILGCSGFTVKQFNEMMQIIAMMSEYSRREKTEPEKTSGKQPEDGETIYTARLKATLEHFKEAEKAIETPPETEPPAGHIFTLDKPKMLEACAEKSRTLVLIGFGITAALAVIIWGVLHYPLFTFDMGIMPFLPYISAIIVVGLPFCEQSEIRKYTPERIVITADSLKVDGRSFPLPQIIVTMKTVNPEPNKINSAKQYITVSYKGVDFRYYLGTNKIDDLMYYSDYIRLFKTVKEIFKNKPTQFKISN